MTVRELITALTGNTQVSIHDIFSSNQDAQKVIHSIPASQIKAFDTYNERTVVLFQPSSAEHIDVYI